MASAIPAAIGVGSSLISGIQGKGAQKRAEQLQRQQLEMLRPFLQEELALTQFAGGQARSLFPQATNAINTTFNQATGMFEPMMKDYRQMLADATSSQGRFNAEGEGFMDTGRNLMRSSEAQLMGALSGLSDLQQAHRPFLEDGARAIERFMPKGQALNRLLSGQFGDINQGHKSASQNIEAFAPRGGGRISSLANADVTRQQDLNAARAGGEMAFGQMALQNFFQGAEGTRNILGQKGQIGQALSQQGLGAIGAGQQSKQLGISDFGSKAGVGLQQLQAALQSLGLAGNLGGTLAQLASGSLGQGLAGGQKAFDLFNQTANRNTSMDLQRLRNQQGTMGLGGFLVDLFNNKGTQDFLGGLFKRGSGRDPASGE